MLTNVNLLAHWATSSYAPVTDKLQLLRIERNQIVIELFTPNAATVAIHFCEERELKSYIRCNGDGCVLCLAGKSVEERVLLPVYVPVEGIIKVLSISPNTRPGALRPPIEWLLKRLAEQSGPVFAVVTKPDRMIFQVIPVQPRVHQNTGQTTVAEFVKRWESGQVDLTEVYPQHCNDVLRAIPGIKTMLDLKEVKEEKEPASSADDKRE